MAAAGCCGFPRALEALVRDRETHVLVSNPSMLEDARQKFPI